MKKFVITSALGISAIFGLFVSATKSNSQSLESPIPVLEIADSINPGTADYLIEGIKTAERQGAAFVVIQLDTPGGLLSSTRSIIQTMLASKIPVVVFVAPKGAHAGSAGALITLAADVAAMAPSTNIGAAHPVAGNGDTLDDTMREKIENDTAAFAESLAKAKGRNTKWAIESVRKSISIISEQALKEKVIDLTAEDLSDLFKKLVGFHLKTPKGGITELPNEVLQPQNLAINLKQRLVSFFSDPNLAYLIMTLGGICLWVELSHPGLIFPGVVGAICLILSLISFQALPIRFGALGLILLGMGMIIAELFVSSYGALGIGGIACFIFGSLFLMDTQAPEFQISLGLILPMAAVLAGAAFVLAKLVFEARKVKPRSGMEALSGEFGEVREAVAELPGKIFLHGEIWNAVSQDGIELKTGAIVVVSEVKDMLLVVRRREAV